MFQSIIMPLHGFGTQHDAIRAQVAGQIISVDFPGPAGPQGRCPAQIDPAPFKAVLDQAVAKKGEDQAQLVDAEKDLARFTTLAKRDYETQQNVDLSSQSDQFKATIDADQAAIEAAQTQLNFATIVARIDGVGRLPQVDVGNIVATNAATPLTVLTQIEPSDVIFTLRKAISARSAKQCCTARCTLADQNDKEQLAEGRLASDRQPDRPGHQHDRLKGEFPNTDQRLWPGEFRSHPISDHDRKGCGDRSTRRGAARSRRLYVWVVKPDKHVEQRSIESQTSTRYGDRLQGS